MTEDLRISMIQSHIIWEDREENLGYYGELLRRVSGRTDLAVLPETFTTGFSMDVEKQADTMESQTVPTIKEWAKKYKLAVAGSFIAKDNGKFYIDFEAMSKDQLPYLDTLKQFAKEHNYPIIETTYNNTPIDYDHVKYAPVLSLKVNADIDSIVHVGKLIEQTIFKNNDQTIYDIVP